MKMRRDSRDEFLHFFRRELMLPDMKCFQPRFEKLCHDLRFIFDWI